MKKLVDTWFLLLKITAITCLALMVVLVFGNVVLRYAFNSGITFSEEASRILFIYLTFLGAAIALREHMHLGIDSVVSRLSPTGRKYCLVASQALMLMVTWLLLAGSWEQAVINLTTRTPVIGLSMAVIYGVGVIFSITTGGLLIANIVRTLAGRLDDREISLTIGAITPQQEELASISMDDSGAAPASPAQPLTPTKAA